MFLSPLWASSVALDFSFMGSTKISYAVLSLFVDVFASNIGADFIAYLNVRFDGVDVLIFVQNMYLLENVTLAADTWL
ncbi:BTE_collapsed_G0004200.mRNA.1.CDS.1 [Saccharomyces cerevisiae]|nr:BTE_collapsed_G0004200.mRNA.1.CDS.1 [Saccharomyces cerevisiae]